MCENVRNYGSYRAWIGGGPLDSCGLVSYNSFPAQAIDYSYLNHVTQPAYAAPVAQASPVAESQPIEAAPVHIAPASNCGCEGAPVALPMGESTGGYIDGSVDMGFQGTSIMQDDVSESLYDETHSFESDKGNDANGSESIPAGKPESDKSDE